MKTWHLLGTVILLIGFPLLFTIPIRMDIDPYNEIDKSKNTFKSTDNDSLLNCGNDDELYLVMYYSFLAILITFGWAAVQVAHLAMVPDITLIEDEQMSLISFRSVATFAAYIFVYLVAWILVGNGKLNDYMIFEILDLKHQVSKLCYLIFYSSDEFQ